MKKVFTLITVLIFLSIVVVAQASALCIIKWWGYFYLTDVSGSALTAETTRTQQATYEAFVNMYNMEPQNWSNRCYNRLDSVGGIPPCNQFYYHTCQDGTWSDGQSYCAHNGSGNWDVFCGIDSDHDLVPDVVDNCPNIYNHNQTDSDGDGIGDACDISPYTCSTWTEVISTYNLYVSRQAFWTNVIDCYNQYVSQ